MGDFLVGRLLEGLLHLALQLSLAQLASLGGLYFLMNLRAGLAVLFEHLIGLLGAYPQLLAVRIRHASQQNAGGKQSPDYCSEHG